jgi:hypothetical protein
MARPSPAAATERMDGDGHVLKRYSSSSSSGSSSSSSDSSSSSSSNSNRTKDERKIMAVGNCHLEQRMGRCEWGWWRCWLGLSRRNGGTVVRKRTRYNFKGWPGRGSRRGGGAQAVCRIGYGINKAFVSTLSPIYSTHGTSSHTYERNDPSYRSSPGWLPVVHLHRMRPGVRASATEEQQQQQR